MTSGRREKKKAAIDFLNLAPIPPGAFDLATRKDQICLKTSTPKNTLLPEDFHYKVCTVHFSCAACVKHALTRCCRDNMMQSYFGMQSLGSQDPHLSPCSKPLPLSKP